MKRQTESLHLLQVCVQDNMDARPIKKKNFAIPFASVAKIWTILVMSVV